MVLYRNIAAVLALFADTLNDLVGNIWRNSILPLLRGQWFIVGDLLRDLVSLALGFLKVVVGPQQGIDALSNRSRRYFERFANSTGKLADGLLGAL